jgi:nitrogen PTS system EIIA component
MNDLTVGEAASLLGVSEKTIIDWIAGKTIPGYRVGDDFRVKRQELLSWAGARRVVVMPGSLAMTDATEKPSLCEALTIGGFHYNVPGKTKQDALRNIVTQMNFPEQANREYVLAELLAREGLGSTGVGDGIAIPHLRTSITPDLARPMASLSFLETPVDFGALDRQPVTAIFVLLSPSVRSHLRLMSLLSFCLREEPVKKAIKAKSRREEVMDVIRIAEHRLALEQKDSDGAAAE